MTEPVFLKDPIFDRVPVDHGFGTRGAQPPVGTVRPRQVHGVEVAVFDPVAGVCPVEADALICRSPGQSVAVLTADCVPILVASTDGVRAVAIHAGWRGLAAGVIDAAIRDLQAGGSIELRAAVGPHARGCCYEGDEPVLEALGHSFGDSLSGAVRPSRPGHVWLHLESLVVVALVRCGLQREDVGTEAAGCTVCDADRFESHRRDGAEAGRLIHWIRPGLHA